MPKEKPNPPVRITHAMFTVKEKKLKKKKPIKQVPVNMAEYNEYKEQISVFLHHTIPLIETIQFIFESLHEIGMLNFYLKDTKYEVFQWILKNNCLGLLEKLVKLISPDAAFSMILHNKDLAVKPFVNGLLQPDPNLNEETISIQYAILKKIIDINPCNIYRYIIAKIVNEHIANNPTAVLPPAFKEIVAELEKSYGTILSASSSATFFSANGSESSDAPQRSENISPNKQIIRKSGI